ncbi:MAG: CPBP family intramembrane glutamic endopeptidase [Actinomycetota bacterium]
MASDLPAPAPSWRIVLSVVALFTGILLAGLIGGSIIAAGGWDFDVSASRGADFGRTVGQFGRGEDLDHNRVPLVWTVIANSPLWLAFVGVPLIARRRGLDWRRDMGWGMRAVDVPLGLGLGIVSQLLLVPLLYLPILPLVEGDDLEEPARELIAGATDPTAVAALILFTVVLAPFCEEVLYRGLLFRGIVDMEAERRGALAIAVVASSAIFAASHLQVLQFPGLMLIGAVAALAMHRTGRLGTAIWTHVGFNATTIAILLPELS